MENPCPVAFTTRVLRCPPISDRILSKELKALADGGLIARRDFGETPPRTEYRLTALGQTLRPLMATMAQWGLKHRADVRPSN